jgi:hypothetical protein
MPLVVVGLALSGGAERLARARARPNRSVVIPPSESQGVTPDADAGEEVALRVSAQVIGPDFGNGSLINVARCDMSRCDQVA